MNWEPSNQGESLLYNDIQVEFGTWVGEMTEIDGEKVILHPQPFTYQLAKAVAELIRLEWHLQVEVK